MASSRTPDEKSAPVEEIDAKKKVSPGRYSIADEGDAGLRMDSTSIPAVRVDLAPPKNAIARVTAVKKPIAGAKAQPPPLPRALVQGATTAEARVEELAPVDPLPEAAPSGTRAAEPAPEAAKSGPRAAEPRPLPPKSASRAADAAPVIPPPARTPSKLSFAAVAPESVAPVTPPPPAVAAPPVAGGPPPEATKAPSIAPEPGEPRRRRSSLRPPPARKASSLPPALAALEEVPPSVDMPLDGFDEGSIAFAFDSLLSDGPTGQPGTLEMDLAPVRELFAELAANHMRHVRDFMIDVKWGEVTRDWIHICIPPVHTLNKAADRLDLKELAAALASLGATLEELDATGGQMLDAAEKDRLLAAYGELVTLLPQAFSLDRDRSQREAVIVQALLLQVPDVRKVTIDKLHAAGLTGLTVLFAASAADIAHVAGIPDVLAARIVERVQAYRTEMKSASPQDARAAEREKLATLAGELRTCHASYEEAANGWSPEAKARKRDAFRMREDKWLEISVVLARFGEVDRLAGIEKVPFSQRIAKINDYLDEAREKYRVES